MAADTTRAPDKLGLPPNAPTVALLAWCHVFEDFLEWSDLDLATFSREVNGGWMFGYVEALRAVGVRVVIMLVLRSVKRVRYLLHEPTGASIVGLPAPFAFRALARGIDDTYAPSPALNPAELRSPTALARGMRMLARESAPYLSTPLLSLGRELRRQRCVALLCQEYEFPRFDVGALVSRLIGIPLFGIFQGAASQTWRLERLTRPASLSACAGLIIGAQGEIDRVQHVYRLPQRKIAKIVNPLDTSLWHPVDRATARRDLAISQDVRVAVWHGRIDIFHKGLDILLDAWSMVCDSLGPDAVWLVLVGGGPDVREVRGRIESLAVRNVTFIDSRVNDAATLRSYLGTGDVYVLASRWEGFPVALVEAMACGLPVVATDVSGARDALAGDEGLAGAVVDKDDAGVLAAALARLLENRDLCAQLGDLARERAVERFGLATVGGQLRDFVLSRCE